MAGPADRAEFERLLREHFDALGRFVRQMCWDRSRAEDALQDAIIAAYKAFDRFERGTNFKAWIFRFVVNTLLNENRRIRKELKAHAGGDPEDAAMPAEADHDYASVLADPDRYFDQISDPVKKALESLSSAERMVFLLKVAEDFNYKEISDMLDMPEGTAMSHLSRGRVKLRGRLAQFAREMGIRETADDAKPRPAAEVPLP